MSEQYNTFNVEISTEFSEVVDKFEAVDTIIDTSTAPLELYPPTKREFYYSSKTPSVLIYSYSDKLQEQIEIFELNKRGL